MKRTSLVWMLATMVAAATPALAVDAVPASAGGGPDTALVHIGPKDGGTNAFVAWPAGKKPAQAIIVAHEWWGLNEQIRTVAERLADQGYVAIVPDLYHGKVATDAESAHELTRSIETDQVMADFTAAIDWLRAERRTKAARIGAMGFCMGGGLVEQLGMSDQDVAALVVFYGRPVVDPESVAKLHAPLLAHFGEDDRGIPLEKVEAFEMALGDAKKDAQVFTYPGAGHAFMNDQRESHRPDAARQAWARTLAFFHKHLKQ